MSDKERVDFISVQNFYDYPRSGWIRVGWKRFWFEDPGNDEDYDVYDTEPASRLIHLKSHIRFRHLVGWYWDYDHNHKYPIVGRFPRETMDEFYETYGDLPPLVKREIQGTTDLKHVIWRDNPDIAP